MATITVTTNLDVVNAGDGVTSLREAVADANASTNADTIVFAAGLAGQTITLNSVANSELILRNDVTIDGDTNGDDKADITISGNNQDRIFKVIESFTLGAYTDVDLKSLTLTNGSARGAAFAQDDDGAAIYMRGATLDISDCTIKDSVANYGGGGLHVNSGDVRIVNSLVHNNSTTDAGSYGGGIRVFGGNLSVTNSTVSGNSTLGAGGGIVMQDGTLTLSNSTLTANRADTDGASTTSGGGLAISGGTTTIVNTVISGNTSGSSNTANDLSGAPDVLDHSIIGGNALLGGLVDNGGTVLTHAPLAGSPLLNAGSNAQIPADVLDVDGDGNTAEILPQDGRGSPRVIDGTVDIGAVEGAGLVVTTAANVINPNDGQLSLREAVAIANASANADVITFASNLAGQTLVLGGGPITLFEDVTIDGDVNGDNKADITLSGGNANGIVNITGATTDVDLKSLTLTAGLAADGGAVSAQSIASLDILDTTITDNQATNRGGGVFTNYVTSLRLVNSLVSGNVATQGGGLYTRVTTATLTNATIHGNESDAFGGGISSAYATVGLLDSTITGNRADANGDAYGTGGGIDNFNSTITVSNTVIADNFSGIGAVENDVNGIVATATNSIFGTAVTITTNNGSTTGVADVGLGQLLDNGGTVLTRSPLDGSVLIATGLNSAVPLDVHDIDGDGNTAERLPLDGRGGPRIVIATVDVGAVEQIVDETIGGTAAGDTILGGLGTDILRGRGGNDTLNGGGGTNDTADYSEATGTGVTVNLGILVAQLISATEGSDTLLGIENVIGSAQGDTLTGDGGINRLSGLAGDDTLRDGAGADILDGELNNDTFLLDADGASDTSIGGDGAADIVNLFFATGATSVTFGATAFAGTAGGGGLGSNSFTGIERIFGSAFVDTISGGAGGEFSAARGGNDVISGGGGGDQLFGEVGNDTINDGSGVDLANGGADNDAFFLAADNQSDTVVGDTGTDTLDLFHATGPTTVVFNATPFAGSASGGGLGVTNFSGIERIIGGNFAETVIGGANDEYFFGRAGADSIFGAQGSDIIYGDIGNDRLNGTAGADFLSGGADADTFVYTHQSQGADTFADFATGIDKVEIARTGFGLAAGYVLNFQTGAAAIGAGQVFLFNPATHQFIFDANGGAAGGAVLLATLSVGSIAAGDILLV